MLNVDCVCSDSVDVVDMLEGCCHTRRHYVCVMLNVDCVCSDSVDVVDMLEGCCHTVSLPINIDSLSVASQFDWVVTESQTNR